MGNCVVGGAYLPVLCDKILMTEGSGLYLAGPSLVKAARFVMDCNQMGLPIVFFQNMQGFMVERDAEQSGIIRSGAKMVNAVSNCVAPKITVVVGGSFGAGNYALCDKAFDPRFIFAWPSARYAVMGAEQAAETLFFLLQRAKSQKGGKESGEEMKNIPTFSRMLEYPFLSMWPWARETGGCLSTSAEPSGNEFPGRGTLARKGAKNRATRPS